MQTTKQIKGYPYVSYTKPTFEEGLMLERVKKYHSFLDQRRSVREFSQKAIPRAVIEQILLAASTAPSGAHKQPWTFCVVSNPEMKKKIRLAAEEEERKSYDGRMSEEWLLDLAPLGTDWQKPFLETAPFLIIVFKRSYEIEANGHKHQNYYVQESVGIAIGLLLAAIHEAGLAALTHTPSPMNFLSNLLKRPINEKPYLLIPIGYVADECWVPDLKRKAIEEISVWYE